MLVIIHDRYYRNAPESIQLSAHVSRHDPSRLSCEVAFKAGHAPEDAGDHSRPPQTLRLAFSGEAFTQWLESDRTVPVHQCEEALTAVVGEAVLAASSRRWKTPTLVVERMTRHMIELVVMNGPEKPVLTLYWPLGVWEDLRSAQRELSRHKRQAGFVVTWECPVYASALQGTAKALG